MNDLLRLRLVLFEYEQEECYNGGVKIRDIIQMIKADSLFNREARGGITLLYYRVPRGQMTRLAIIAREALNNLSKGRACRSTFIRVSMRPARCRRAGHRTEAVPSSTRCATQRCCVSYDVCGPAGGKRSLSREISATFITSNTNPVGWRVSNSFPGQLHHETERSIACDPLAGQR